MNERLEQSVSVALLVLAAACGVGFAAAWPPGGEPGEVALKAWLAGAVILLLVAVRLGPLRRRPRLAAAVLALCAVAGVWAHTNFGRFHFPVFAHYWEQFHYQLGARYFPELGYDGLYLASIAAERRIAPERPAQRKVRDLRTNRVRLYEKLEDHAAEVRGRFAPPSWRAFVNDNRHFVRAIRPADLQAMRRDHGYNPTPAWTFVAQQVQGGERFTAKTLRRLGAVDALLLAAAFVVLFRTYGFRTGCLCLVIFGLGYAGRFKWIGGAFLRFDWLAALILAACALRQGRGLGAGLALGYATAVRLFPVVFLLGPAVAALAAWRRGERPVWPARLLLGFGLALLLAFAAGSLAGRGVGAWSEFAQRMQLYQLSVARNSVGLEWLALYGGETLARAAEAQEGDAAWPLQREQVAARKQDRALFLRGLQAVFLLLVVVAVWRAPPDVALVASMAALFAVTLSAGYYWSLLALAPLAVRWPGVLVLLLVNAAMYLVHEAVPDKLVRYGLLSWGMLAVFLSWLVPEALRVGRGALPGWASSQPEPADAGQQQA
ncbi:MAG: hypothetical protein ACQGVC_23855 [Myxococcota bacterium]